MAVALDQNLGTGQNSAALTVSMTTTADVASGAHIILVVGHFVNGVTTRACAGGSLTWTEDVYLRASSLHISIFRAHAPAGLASGTAITVTYSNSGDSIVGATSYTGIDTTGTLIATGTSNGATAGWSSGTVSSTSGNALIGGSFVDNSSVSSSTPTAPGTERFDKNVAAQSETLTMVDKLSVSGSDVIDGAWNAAGGWIAGAACYKAAAGGAAAAPKRSLMLGVG